MYYFQGKITIKVLQRKDLYIGLYNFKIRKSAQIENKDIIHLKC